MLLVILSLPELTKYQKKNDLLNYQPVMNSPHAPWLSVIAPAYNEANSIDDAVRSLMNLNYHQYELIVVNDGSKDDTLSILKEKYTLVLTDEEVEYAIPCAEIIGIYRSSNPAFAKLVVIDKQNAGSKADAMNAGINVCQHPYFVAIDADCVLDSNTLLVLSKPFMENRKHPLIAAGGVVRVANGCKVEGGQMKEIRVPKGFWAKVQVLEYLRAFLIGRIAWNKMDGLLIVSGAFGMFDKTTVVECGGCYNKSIGEDMELVVRMRKMMRKQGRNYEIAFIPDPLCWTEAPGNLKILAKQRRRWSRGTIQTIWLHREMFFNPKYRFLGLVSVPYWFFFEYLAPMIEFFGIFITILFGVYGIISWKFLILIQLFIYSFSVMFSFFGLFAEEQSYHQYAQPSDIRKLVFAAMVEPFLFHPVIFITAIQGLWEMLSGKEGWAEMKKVGFSIDQ
jgi:cellulose synthase/poly-beta-1,6-N-acetylglucosamine synthase-like glycosyltransferase